MNIELKNVNKYYDINNDSYIVFKNLNIKFSNGIYVIYGNNCSGKTTILNILSGTDRKFEGDILYNDKVLNRKEYAQLINSIGYIGINNFFDNDLNVRDNIIIPSLFERKYDARLIERKNELLKKFNYENILDYRISYLSNSQLVIIAFIRAIILKPKILLIDEVFSFLDDYNKIILIKELKQLAKDGTTVIITSRNSEVIDFADHFMYIDNKGIKGE